jgi:RNA polymerase sigma-70 factor, ECF subfamily
MNRNAGVFPGRCDVKAEDKSVGSGISEAEAIRMAQRGDAQAFEHLYERHKGRVFSVCLRVLKDASEAEDITQEAFLQVFRKIHTFRGDAEFSTWLHRITVNAALMRLRRKSLVDGSIDEMNERNEESDAPRREFGSYDLHLTGVVDRLGLQRAIERLPAGYRAMLLLHDVEGYQHHEIAEILGCSVGNSKSQLHKARQRVRDFLRDPVRENAYKERRGCSENAKANPVRQTLEYSRV